MRLLLRPCKQQGSHSRNNELTNIAAKDQRDCKKEDWQGGENLQEKNCEIVNRQGRYGIGRYREGNTSKKQRPPDIPYHLKTAQANQIRYVARPKDEMHDQTRNHSSQCHTINAIPANKGNAKRQIRDTFADRP